MSFYSNICKLLSTLHGGIKHQRPSVKLPLSKVGLELSRILTHLGIIEDFSIGQRLSRVRAHSRLWDPTRTSISSSADAAGYPAMYLTLHLNYDKYKPLWCRTPLAAAPHVPTSAITSSSSSSSTGSMLPDPQNFTPPMGVNSPTPETVKIISKPSVQRWMGVKELLHARVTSRPGIFLLSTPQGILTDIDCELRGIGGTVLAHLGLPLAHVIQLRGLLRQKYLSELQASLPPRLSVSDVDAATQKALTSAGRIQHIPLAEWDARAAAVTGLAERVQQQVTPGQQLITSVMQGMDEAHRKARRDRAMGQTPDLTNPHELLLQAQEVLAKLELREAAWQQRDRSQQGSSRDDDSGSSSSSRFSSGLGRSRGGRGGDRFAGGRQAERSGRQTLFGDRQQREGGRSSGVDSWQPDV